jgi:hypothetical protein
MFRDVHDHEEVSGRTGPAWRVALAGKLELLTGGDSARDLYSDHVLECHPSLCVTGRAPLLDVVAAAVAVVALRPEQACATRLAAALADGTGLLAAIWVRSVARARPTSDSARHDDLALDTRGDFFEVQRDGVAEVLTALSAAATEQVAPDAAEYFTNFVRSGRAAILGVQGAKAVIACALLGIGERAVRLCDVSETLVCRRVFLIAVRVPTSGESAIGSLDVLRACVS